MTNELFLQIISAILTILVALITTFVIPWFKARFTKEQMDAFNYYLDLAVRCANQIYTPEQWAEKKTYVTHYLTDVVNDKFALSLTEQDIDVLIEGTVKKVKEIK